MLLKRIIPCLDVKDGRVVKGIHFEGLRDAGDPVEIAKRYEQDGADELVLLDISASHEGRAILLDVVRRVAEQCFMPFTVGGGIRSLKDATKLIQAGAEKVSLNTAAVENPGLVAEISRKFGRCATVVNIDPKRDQASPARQDGDSIWRVHIHGGRTPTRWEAVAWAEEVERLGAGEIILTSMDADGTKSGYDLPMLEAVCNAVNIPVVASGGAGEPVHLAEAFRVGASAALAASIFHYDEYSIPVTKADLASRGVAVRIT